MGMRGMGKGIDIETFKNLILDQGTGVWRSGFHQHYHTFAE
jgi:hypothetical protein